MMKRTSKLFIALLLTLLMVSMIIMPAVAADPPILKVDLKTTSSFAVLAYSAVTNTGTTIINGDAGNDVGISPGTSFTGADSVTMTGGTQHLNDAVAIEAQTDLKAAYIDAAGRPATSEIVANLGGTTLLSGVYHTDSGISIDGTLTLDARGDPEAVFIFQAGSTLITGVNSKIELINGARYCRVFWQVGSSATLGTDSQFVGHIFAYAAITVNAGAHVQGQLLAITEAVTLDNNTIQNGICAASATLHVVKQVINNDNGTASAADFTLYVKDAEGANVYGSPAAGSALGTTYSLIPGNYVVSEDAHTGYTTSYTGADSNGNITLASGDVATVTITNNDVTPTPPTNPPDDTGYPTNPPDDTGYPTNPPDDTGYPTNPPDDTGYPTNPPDDTGYPTNPPDDTGYPTNPPDDTVYPTNPPDDTVYPTNPPDDMVYAPIINVIKTPEPLMLPSQGGSVTYTYKVTNPGVVELSDVSVTDDKLSPVTYVSGDVNFDNRLQPNETWIYTGTTTLDVTTTNTATATGGANGMTVTDIAIVTVIVPSPVVTTVTGGQLPSTATPWYTILLTGSAFIVLGAVCWKLRRFYE
jgi:hypothetical protein